MLVTPAQHLRTACARLEPLLRPGTPVVLCAKGIELSTGCLMSEAAEASLPASPVGVLSGPTFAVEVAKGLPTAVTLAIRDQELGSRIVETLGSRDGGFDAREVVPYVHGRVLQREHVGHDLAAQRERRHAM